MLIEFSISNFLSFKDKVTFSMLEVPLKEKYPFLENNQFTLYKNIKLLKTAAIYGANASGKSNLIKSLSFFITHIIQSQYITEKNIIPVQPFLLSTDMKDKPSYFEITIFKNQKFYRYGFELNTTEILKEWFFIRNDRESLVFKREGLDFEIQKKYKILNELKIKKMIPKNALLISKSAQFNEPVASELLDALFGLKIISGIKDSLYREYTISQLDNPVFKNQIQELLNYADICIEDIKKINRDADKLSFSGKLSNIDDFKVEKSKQLIPDVLFYKNVYDTNLNIVEQQPFNAIYQESEGTLKFFHIAGPVLDCLSNGYTLIVDELDTKLHPLLVQKIVELFHNSITNPKNAQLIFTTHNTSLFSSKIFRRDQIWLTDKNKYGSTDIYSLADFVKDKKKVRNDEAYEKNYLIGKYGAIPFLGKFDDFEIK